MGCGSSKVKPADVIEPDKFQKRNEKNSKSKSSQINAEKEMQKLICQLEAEAAENQSDFPDPESIEVLEHTPIQKGASHVQDINMEDTFWSKKKKLVPCYSDMLKIDQHALQAPSSLKSDPEKLVKYLLKAANTEVEKVRVLVRWIGDNIAYNVDGYLDGNYGDCSLAGVIQSGQAVCEGYATVLHGLCQFAEIECKKIHGQTKNGASAKKEIRIIPKTDHAWNQVKIRGEWFMVDSTWSAGSVDLVKRTFTKEWKEWWFLTDPEAFIYSHLPMTRDGAIAEEDQMIKQPYSVSEKWDMLTYRSPYAYFFGMNPLNYQNTNIQTKDSKLSIKYTCNTKLHHFVTIKDLQNSSSLESHCKMLYERNGVVTIDVRFPHHSEFQVDIKAQVNFTADKKETVFKCLQYRVDNHGGNMHPFPGKYSWGETKEFTGAGFHMIQPIYPTIEAENGIAKIKIKLPSHGIVPNLFDFIYPDPKNNSEVKLDGHVYAEKKGRLATFYIQTPHPGEFRFQFYVKNDKEMTTFKTGTTVLVKSKKATKNVFLQHNEAQLRKLGGPGPEFYKLGFTTNRKSTSIYFDGDTVVLHIKKTKQAYISAHLKSAADQNAEKLLDKEETEEECIITVKEPQVAGFYWINLFGGLERYASKPYIGSFCVPYKIPFLQR